jgi:hypothetical protein
VRDEELLKRFAFRRSAQDEAAADEKAIEFLRNSPYKDKLGNAGLFLRAATAQARRTPSLFGARFGNRLIAGHQVRPLLALMSSAPTLQRGRLDQVAALPLGARVKVDPWSGRVELIKSKPVALFWAGEKMPFEVTPLFPYLTRLKDSERSQSSQQLSDPPQGTDSSTALNRSDKVTR